MKCQHCPKLSTLQITEIHGESNFEEFHLCEECAQKYLYETSPKKKKGDAFGGSEKHCDQCGTKFVDFRNSGRLGCPHDYRAFQAELLPLLESIHSATRHAGKTPRRPSQACERRNCRGCARTCRRRSGRSPTKRRRGSRDRIRNWKRDEVVDEHSAIHVVRKSSAGIVGYVSMKCQFCSNPATLHLTKIVNKDKSRDAFV